MFVKRQNGSFRIIPANDVTASDKLIINELLPCLIDIDDEGLFSFKITEGTSNFNIYHRDNPLESQKALQEAFSIIYQSFKWNNGSRGLYTTKTKM